MASHKRSIEAKIISGKIHYIDEGHVDNPDKHVHKGDPDTISWISHDGDIEIHFDDGSLFNPPQTDFHAPKNTATTPATFATNPPDSPYKYKVTIKDPKTHKPIVPPDDPQIIFDNGLPPDLRLFGDSLDKLGTQAQQAFQGLLSDLKSTAGVKRDPNGVLFPGGINSIEVQVTIPLLGASVIVNLTVSGAPPTAFFPE